MTSCTPTRATTSAGSSARGPIRALTIDLASSDFDPVLIVRGAADSSLVNDDGGPGCASRVAFTAPSSRSVHDSRQHHEQPAPPDRPLHAVRQRRPAAAGRSPATASRTVANAGALNPIAIGETMSGSLTETDELYPDTTYYQRWQFSARPGQDVTIDLSSSDFDPVLIVRGTADTSIVNDDGGPGCASRVAFTAALERTVHGARQHDQHAGPPDRPLHAHGQQRPQAGGSARRRRTARAIAAPARRRTTCARSPSAHTASAAGSRRRARLGRRHEPPGTARRLRSRRPRPRHSRHLQQGRRRRPRAGAPGGHPRRGTARPRRCRASCSPHWRTPSSSCWPGT